MDCEESPVAGQRKRIGRQNTRAGPLFREFIAGCGIYIRVVGWLQGAEESMRAGAKQFVSAMAAIAVAMHTALWAAVAAFAPAPAVDPFTVICHGETSAPVEQAPAHGAPVPAHACDHCNLCSGVAPPPAPVTALSVRFAQARTLQVLRPLNIARHDHIAGDPKLARGPPALA
jgi:hypothetical protein